jgi:hypothetical protein
MPSMAHEILVELFKSRPRLAAEILAEALGFALPAYTEARLASIDLTQVQPAEYRADLVVLLHRGDDLVCALIVEVQLTMDPRKRLTLPRYVTASRALHGCPTCLLVVAPDPAVARWCAEPIETGVPGFVLRPPVLGLAQVPIVTDPAEATRRPELGVLSAMAHGAGEQGAAIAGAVLPAVRGLDDERARFYEDLVLICLNKAARRALEALMKGYQFQSDFAQHFVSDTRARDVLTAFRVRGIAVSDAARERILAQEDGAQLQRWLERAIVAASVAEALDEPS